MGPMLLVRDDGAAPQILHQTQGAIMGFIGPGELAAEAVTVAGHHRAGPVLVNEPSEASRLRRARDAPRPSPHAGATDEADALPADHLAVDEARAETDGPPHRQQGAV